MKSFASIAAVLTATSAVLFASLTVDAAPTRSFSYGYTGVKLSSEFTGAITALKLDVKAFKGSVLRDGNAYFGISDGDIDLANAKAEIAHVGGLRIAAGNTVVELRDFIIDTTGTKPVLTGKVIANDSFVGRIPLFDLTLPALTLPLADTLHAPFKIPGVKVNLTDTAANALNGVFGVTAFVPGFPIGEATVNSSLFRN